MSPESELLFLLLGSMIMYHFKSKYFGGTTAQRAPPAAPASAPPSAPSAPGRMPARPIMRAPTSDGRSGGLVPGSTGGGMPPGLMSMMAKML
jgi:hypothetical protein